MGVYMPQRISDSVIERLKQSISAERPAEAFGVELKGYIGLQKSNPSTTYFVYDEMGHLIGEYDAAGALIQETVWLNDIPVATIRSSGTFYIHTDQLNTPRKLTRSTDNVIVWRWDSGAYGDGLALQDPDGDSVQTVFNLRMPGQYFDSETGLHYNYFRTYDPAVGGYTQSDPIGLDGGINTYEYAQRNPVKFSDPYGLFPIGGCSICHGSSPLHMAPPVASLPPAPIWPDFSKPKPPASSSEGGLADRPAPYNDTDEDWALTFTPDPFGGDEACKRLAEAIRILRAQIAWRRTDLNPGSGSYVGHVKRIAILTAALNVLEASHRSICGGECK